MFIPENGEIILKVDSISKRFGTTQALDKFSLRLLSGEVLALLGENGAGKSTVAKILSGNIIPDEGDIFVNSRKVRFNNPNDAMSLGISLVYQEQIVVKNLPVWANIFLGNEKLNKMRLLSKEKMKLKSRTVLNEMGLNLDPSTLMSKLSPAETQIVIIVKALIGQVRVLILDEPTSSITQTENERLFAIINELKKKGVGVIYISHRLKEVLQISNRIIVLRDGKHIDTINVKNATEDVLIKLITGKKIELLKSTKIPPKTDKILLKCNNIYYESSNQHFSFELKPGEILGIGGLMGSGKEHVNKVIFGLEPIIKGNLFINGVEVKPKPQIMLEKGVIYSPSDRQDGLVLDHNILENLFLPSLELYSNKWKLLKKQKIKAEAIKCIKRLEIRPADYRLVVKKLSGGNRQKVLIGKCLTRPIKLLLLDEPTRGVDIAVRAYIYEFIRKLAFDGASIVVVSSDINELFALSTKIMTMFNGICSDVFKPSDITEEDFLGLCFRGKVINKTNKGVNINDY